VIGMRFVKRMSSLATIASVCRTPPTIVAAQG